MKNNVADLVWMSPDFDFELVSLQCRQAISELYLIKAEVRSSRQAILFKELLHTDAKIVIKCGEFLEEDRILGGLITGFIHRRTRYGSLPNASGKNYLYEVEIRPHLWLCKRQQRSMVFQKQSVQDIVSLVLDRHGISYQWRLSGAPREREYVVQYNESDYSFISRLLEDEGICFYFDQWAGITIFSNDMSAHPDCAPTAEAIYVEEISPRFQFGKQEFIKDFSYQEEIGAGSFATHHYNHETSQIDIGAANSQGQVPNFERFEHYEHSLNYPTHSDGDVYSNLMMEEETARIKVGMGIGSNRSFEAGHMVNLSGHFVDEYNGKWLLTSCFIAMEQGNYQCEFTALPSDTPYRPRRKTPKPKVNGLQTAIVTGPQGSKVYLDQLGRCKIQFHWDREGSMDDKASCWVRVSNNYAGKDYGIQWIPRVGHEVLVSFINGDPDQPVVTGRVYNDFNTPPLGPAEKFQNIIKSIKDNHIMFDDKDGSELVDVRAEKDMNTLVVHDDRQTVGNNRTIKVEANHKESIGENMEITIGDNLKEKVGKDYTEAVGNNYVLTIGKNREVAIGSSETLSVEKDSRTAIGGNRVISIGKSASLEVNDDIGVSGGKDAAFEIENQLMIKVGKASVLVKKNGDIQVSGKNIKIKGSGNITAKASKVGIN